MYLSTLTADAPTLSGLKEDLPHHRIREELRRTAYKLRNTIRRNGHSELVITSEKTYKGAVEDFAEGLVLSVYSFEEVHNEGGREFR
ncbi:MAG: hypothetical protein MZV63_70325 [Marinilabiliales bacterium]|nr:hypothetical protein [Marinilabiliales bacterium]